MGRSRTETFVALFDVHEREVARHSTVRLHSGRSCYCFHCSYTEQRCNDFSNTAVTRLLVNKLTNSIFAIVSWL
jgi:hypothetical protein